MVKILSQKNIQSLLIFTHTTMAQIKKKHTAGAARNFITRTQAIRKLQVSLADFRRLCIFKGIYPREPRSKKKANKGSTAPVTFYYSKDIQYLLHEPVLDKFREHKTFAKKLTRALGRGDLHDAKRIDANRPRYHLDHIIKERYPTFMDALRDIDDALSMLFLFAALPASDDVSARLVSEAEAICTQWMAFVARERLVRKVFVSIKGVYYSANIRGVEVMWLVPFRFPQNIPADIDFRVMLTFLEFYTTLLHFVLYKLYNENGLVFPPIINSAKLSGVGGINAYALESRQNVGVVPQIEGNTEAKVEKVSAAILSKAAKADAGNDEEVEEEEEVEDEGLDSFSAEKGDALAQPTFNSSAGQLFSNFTIFIGREVPLDIIEFLIIAFGGKTISESAMDELIDNEDESRGNVVDEKTLKQKFNLASVTHQICDRPTLREKVPGRTYVQPQWVFDSINEGKLLPVSDYAPGEALPAHLSPWGDAGTYDPTADISDAEDDEEDDEEEIEVAPEDYDKDDEEEEAEAEAKQHQRELEAEVKGTKAEPSSSKPKRKADKMTKAEKQEEEDKKLRMIMMSNKQKKLYKKMQYSNDKKSDREAELKKRRKLNEKKDNR